MGVAFVESLFLGFFLYPIPFCPSYSHKFATNTRLQTARTNRFSQNNHPALQLDFSGSRCLSGGFEEQSVCSSAPHLRDFSSNLSGACWSISLSTLSILVQDCRGGGAANPSTERVDNHFPGRVTQAGRGRNINDPSATLSRCVVSLPSDVNQTQMFSSGVLLNLHLILETHVSLFFCFDGLVNPEPPSPWAVRWGALTLVLSSPLLYQAPNLKSECGCWINVLKVSPKLS